MILMFPVSDISMFSIFRSGRGTSEYGVREAAREEMYHDEPHYCGGSSQVHCQSGEQTCVRHVPVVDRG